MRIDLHQPGADDSGPQVFINPELISISEEFQTGAEGAGPLRCGSDEERGGGDDSVGAD